MQLYQSQRDAKLKEEEMEYETRSPLFVLGFFNKNENEWHGMKRDLMTSANRFLCSLLPYEPFLSVQSVLRFSFSK